MVLQAIKYTRGSLQILDQLQLPHREIYQDIQSAEDAWHAIKDMHVRGAPAIAIVAALALAVELHNGPNTDEQTGVKFTEQRIVDKLHYLITSRPTAVNLADAATKLENVVMAAAAGTQASSSSIRQTYTKTAERMLMDDVRDNENIGEYGSRWILDLPRVAGRTTVSVLTHCNTGYALAMCIS